VKSFRSAVRAHNRKVKSREAARRKRGKTKEKTKSRAIAKHLTPFEEAASVLEALMKRDSNFRKFMKKEIDSGEGNHYITSLASMKFGKHRSQYGRLCDMEPDYQEKSTEWWLVIILISGDKVNFEIRSNDDSISSSLVDAPERVFDKFRSIAEILKNENRVYDFLLKKVDTWYIQL